MACESLSLGVAMSRHFPEPSSIAGFNPLAALTLIVLLAACEHADRMDWGGNTLSADETEALRDVALIRAREQTEERARRERHPLIPRELHALLTMNYQEASAISKENLEVSGQLRLCCESVKVIQRDPAGRPTVLRARGKVFVQMGNIEDPITALCQELFVDRREVVLRGRPIISRGEAIIEGLADDTLAYVIGSRIRVIGKHRLASAPTTEAIVSTQGFESLANLPALPELRDTGPWKNAPNPLLPPLDQEQVPASVRQQLMQADRLDRSANSKPASRPSNQPNP